MKCTRCKIDYPRDCVDHACLNGEYVTLCGQCALEETNELHGLNRKRFDGQLAEDMRQRTLAYRRTVKQ
jgi:hypothetical protein